jgi:hypothetical protein
MTDTYFVTSPGGFVHRLRNGRSCAASASGAPCAPVTLNQALVFSLLACQSCWRDAREYERLVRGAV